MKAGPYSRLGVPGHSLPAVSSGGLLWALAVASSGDLCPGKVIPCVSVSISKKGSCFLQFQFYATLPVLSGSVSD